MISIVLIWNHTLSSLNADPVEKDVITLKEVCSSVLFSATTECNCAHSPVCYHSSQMQLLKKESVSEPEKPVPAPGPPDDPPATSSASIPDAPPLKSASLPTSASKPPQSTPGDSRKDFKDPLVEGAGAKEEYGYIVTNQRSALLITATNPSSPKLDTAKHEMMFTKNTSLFCCSHLSLYNGVKLLELLADKIHLTTSSFINIR